MKFCNQCGSALERRVPDGDNRTRCICRQCGHIHYENPKVVAGCIPVWKEKILLCRRAIEPRYGFWTIPAGFMENEETVQQSASRETAEEANARVANLELYHIYNIVHVNQVYIIFRGTLVDLDFSAGDESLEVRLFGREEIPWPDMAFRVVHDSVQRYFTDLQQNRFDVFLGDIFSRLQKSEP